MNHSIRDRTLALAGLFQAAVLVQQVARRNQAEEESLATCVESLFATDPDSVEAVYGGAGNLEVGLRTLRTQLGGGNAERDLDLTRYVVALLHLERKLAKRRDLLDGIAEGLDGARRQLQQFGPTHVNLIAVLADIYLNTISTLTPRIIVSGEQGYLSNPENANRVRALLLAGIRSAVLWRQCGGSRWQLLFKRGALLEEAERLLA